MHEDAALRILDEQLDAVLSGIKAPPQLTSNVLRAVRQQRVSRLPEIFDAIGWGAVLAITLVVLVLLTPANLMPAVTLAFGAVSILVSLAFALHFTRQPRPEN